jgi:FkbM family methyltransferase
MKLEAVEYIKTFVYWALKTMAKPLVGKGLKLRYLRHLYNGLTNRFIPTQEKVVVINDCLIKVSDGTRGLDGTTGTLVATGKYEPITTEYFKKIITDGINVIDVGANIGYYSLLSAKLTKGLVYAVEPEPRNLSLLKENIELNRLKNVVVIDKAVSDKNGIAKCYVSKDESGEHSLVHGREHIKDTIDVEVAKLDDIIKDKIGLIKIDTEGNEIAVLKGAERIIKSNSLKLIVEVWYPGLKASGYDINDLVNLLREYGYSKFEMIDEVSNSVILGTNENIISKLMNRCVNNDISVNLFCSKGEIN